MLVKKRKTFHPHMYRELNTPRQEVRNTPRASFLSQLNYFFLKPRYERDLSFVFLNSNRIPNIDCNNKPHTCRGMEAIKTVTDIHIL